MAHSRQLHFGRYDYAAFLSQAFYLAPACFLALVVLIVLDGVCARRAGRVQPPA